MLHTSIMRVILSRVMRTHLLDLPKRVYKSRTSPSMSLHPEEIISGLDYTGLFLLSHSRKQNQRMLAHTSSFDTGKMPPSCLNCLRRVFGRTFVTVRYKMLAW